MSDACVLHAAGPGRAQNDCQTAAGHHATPTDYWTYAAIACNAGHMYSVRGSRILEKHLLRAFDLADTAGRPAPATPAPKSLATKAGPPASPQSDCRYRKRMPFGQHYDCQRAMHAVSLAFVSAGPVQVITGWLLPHEPSSRGPAVQRCALYLVGCSTLAAASLHGRFTAVSPES